MRRLACFGIVMALSLGGCDGETEDTDAGTPGTDSGTPGIDSGTEPDEDAGEADEDAGTPDEDAGTLDDAGTSDAGADPDGGPTTGCAPGTVTIEETCPAFTACGSDDAGDVVGEWCYTNVCITEDEIFGDALDTCPGATLTLDEATVSGSVVFDATTVSREAATHIEATLVIPGACRLGGAVTCATIQGQIGDALGPDGDVACADNTDTPAGCDCEITIDGSLSSADTYTADAGDGEITVGTGADERTYDYCVEDGDLRFRDTTGGDEEEPGIQTLTLDTSS